MMKPDDIDVPSLPIGRRGPVLFVIVRVEVLVEPAAQS